MVFKAKRKKEITYGVVDMVSILLSDLVIEFSKRISDKSTFRDGFLEIGDMWQMVMCKLQLGLYNIVLITIRNSLSLQKYNRELLFFKKN